MLFVAMLGDRYALNQLHHEVRLPCAGDPAVQHAGDVGMVHDGQRLPFRLEPGDDILGGHSGLSDLQSRFSTNGLDLLGDVDHAHPALANDFPQLVRANSFAIATGVGKRPRLPTSSASSIMPVSKMIGRGADASTSEEDDARSTAR